MSSNIFKRFKSAEESLDEDESVTPVYIPKAKRAKLEALKAKKSQIASRLSAHKQQSAHHQHYYYCLHHHNSNNK